MARRLNAGTVYVNRYFHPGVRYPSGGIKASGYGQSEGLEAYRNYLQLKTVAIETHAPN